MKGLMRVWLVGGLIAAAVPVQAGWVVDWSNVVTTQNGDSLPPETATMQIEGNKVRLTQPQSATIIDYKNDSFTIINPKTQSFWSGTTNQYLAQVNRKRRTEMAKRSGRPAPKDDTVPTVDETKLPLITIQKTEATKTIAGHTTTKYEILSGGTPFQEMWVASDINVSADLDPERFLSYQRQLSAGMQGNTSGPYQALYRSEEYKKLVSGGFALAINAKHPSGGFDRTVTAIRREDIPASAFEVPSSYRRVALSDVLPKPDTGVAGDAQQKPLLPSEALKQQKSAPAQK